MDDRRSIFMKLYGEGATIGQAGILFGLNASEMHRALWSASVAKGVRPRKPQAPIFRANDGRLFCNQCDKLVYADEADRCRSPFCKAKAQAA